MENKIREAVSLVKGCIGEKGVWASTDRYRNQCWTRDFCLATSYLFMFDEELKNISIVKEHLLEIAKRQCYDVSNYDGKNMGKIPILFLDNEREFLRDKIDKSIAMGKKSFMLERYLDGEVENLTPHTRDSELLFINTVIDLFNSHMDCIDTDTYEILTTASGRALGYIKKNILKDNLVMGADWRDTRTDLDNKNVLTNACLLYRIYSSLNQPDDAARVKEIIQEKYWNYCYFIDYPGNENFDILGNSLCILYGIASTEQADCIFRYAINNLSTPYGFKMMDTFLPALNSEEQKIMERDGAVVWPFTNGFLLEAMIKKGGMEWITFAKKEFEKWNKLEGFYEWYDIKDGKGYGSKNQTWSAALYLRVKNSFNLTSARSAEVRIKLKNKLNNNTQ